MSQADVNDDVLLIDRMNRGDETAFDTFRARNARLLYQICRSVAPNETAAIAAYNDLVAADEFGSLFLGFDGKSKFSTFAVDIVIKRFLFRRLLQMVSVDPQGSFLEFHAFWRHGFHRKVAEKIKDPELCRDALQWIYEKLVDDDCEQLRAWARDAQKESYIYKKVGFLTRDFLNSRDAPAHTRKRALPAAIERLGEFDQRVFQQVYWRRTIATQAIWMSLLQLFPDATETEVIDAKVRVDRALGSKGIAEALGETENSFEVVETLPAPDPGGNPDFQPFMAKVLELSSVWSQQDRLVFLLFTEGKPSRDISAITRLPVEKVNKIKRNLLGRIRTALKSDLETKTLIAAVTGNDSYLDSEPAQVPPARRGTDKP